MKQVSPQILFEDDALLIINKPSGVIVNRSETAKSDTLQDWATQYLKLSEVAKEKTPDTYATLDTFYSRSGIVHRLDKETSGVLVIAKTPEAFLRLQQEFKERIVDKKYIALTHGVVSPSVGEIKAPVGRLPWNRKQFGIISGGRDSVTMYKTISTFKRSLPNAPSEKLTLLELCPETGRTHQIRVHLKYIGFPIFSDFLYAGRKTSRGDRQFLSRVFLHAKELSLLHPVTGERVVFSAPLPRELEFFLEKLERVE